MDCKKATINRAGFKCWLAIFFLFAGGVGFSQTLQPGFNAGEYLQLLSAADRFHDSINYKLHTPYPDQLEKIFRSPAVGLDNCWEFWMRNDRVGVIVIRGTTTKSISWLENFYCAMIPAIGSLQVNDSTKFNYKLAADSGAFVHAGWTLGLSFIAPDIVQRINEAYGQGIKEFLIFGHSQGGALTFLLTSYLYYLRGNGLPADIIFKSYCSAAPKPGNLYYAYDFDFITRGGWAQRVVSALDWVPESPLTIQTNNDVNEISPLRNASHLFKKQKFFVRLYLNHVYGSMDKSSRKARNRMQKYLGHGMYKQIHKTFPQFKEPAYAPSMYYMTAGVPVTLLPYPEYRQKFVDTTGKNLFIHHSLAAYNELVQHYYIQPK